MNGETPTPCPKTCTCTLYWSLVRKITIKLFYHKTYKLVYRSKSYRYHDSVLCNDSPPANSPISITNSHLFTACSHSVGSRPLKRISRPRGNPYFFSPRAHWLNLHPLFAETVTGINVFHHCTMLLQDTGVCLRELGLFILFIASSGIARTAPSTQH